ncbi:TonB-dependent receptor plug domain-containing protein [Metapseudomonas otitidis]|uniref:TonB-dependent receptor plug domain-containing protein n=1 Tax=Metapseudomonas otitidis TaxID=319939 RepID=UPI001F0D655A|nr:TonB-dependent receptor plug domain-containing protein [Pseudomonas otitidis]
MESLALILFLFLRAPHDRCRSGTRRHPPVRSTLSASNWLGGWLRHRLDNAWDAADLTQGTFVRVLAAHQQRTLPTLADLVASDPLVRSTNTSAGRFEQFSIRGCSLYNSDVAFGGLPTYSIDMEMVERVDVLKGPGALLGRLEPNGSVGGSINIEPKRSGADPVTEFTAMQASTGQLGGHVDIGRRFGEDQRFGLRFNGVKQSGDTEWGHQHLDRDSAVLGLDLRAERVRLSLDLGRQTRDVDGPMERVGLNAGVKVPDPKDIHDNFAQSWAYSRAKDTFGALRGEYDLGDSTLLYAAVGARKGDYDLLRHAVQVTNDRGQPPRLPAQGGRAYRHRRPASLVRRRAGQPHSERQP